MIYYKNKHCSYRVIYYGELCPSNSRKVDIIKRCQDIHKGLLYEKFYTLIIYLTDNEQVIFNRFEKNTRYEIRRAELKDKCTSDTLDLKTGMDKLLEMYSVLARTKGLRDINRQELERLADTNMLEIRGAYSHEGELLVLHSYIKANNRARLAHSVSLFRTVQENEKKNLIGRANRMLHWHDILYFKEKGFLQYDFGGINPDKNNVETQAINRFKECFGGNLVIEYNSESPASIKGFFALLYKGTSKIFSF